MVGRRGGETDFSPAQKLAALRLFRTENIGAITYRQLVSRFGSAEAALETLPTLLKKTGRPARVCTLSEAEDEMAQLADLGARLVTLGEPDYPEYLSQIVDAPPVISLLGGVGLNWQQSVAIVGARNASTAGVKMTRVLAEGLGALGYCLVSGLARGIDTAAHRASLRSGTVAVLAGGLDRVYPDDNRPLAEDILSHGGALISEMPLGWEPRARDFPRRNRLVSGLALGVVVVEAAKRSGSLITARLALEQGREVMAVPGSPLDPRAEGGNHLIRQGAQLVTSAAEVVEVLEKASPRQGALFEPMWEPDFSSGEDDGAPQEGARERVIRALSVTPVEVDELIAQTGISPAAMQMVLLELDLAGQIEWSAGQMVARSSE